MEQKKRVGGKGGEAEEKRGRRGEKEPSARPEGKS